MGFRACGDLPGLGNAKGPTGFGGAFRVVNCGDVLLSHTVSRAVPSALKGLTSGFGMGPGVSPSQKSPQSLYVVVTVAGCFPGTAQGREHRYFLRRVVVSKSLGLLVPVNSTPCGASISGLSTQCSAGGLTPLTGEGVLILRQVSRLDAFSGYPFRT